MFRKVLTKIRNILKEPVLNWIYTLLMSPAKRFAGRRLFDAEELKLIHQALLSQNLFGIGGKMVPEFEKEFAKTYGVPYAVASTSGTAAIHTALGALDLNPGDEVITAPITDLGTVIPILYQQCIPIFADVDKTYNMDPVDVERKITPRTKAIIVVHLFGNPCDMEAMLKIARKHNVTLIEDCSQAHVTEYKGRYVGTIGDIGCFSFQQAKHMTTGDGGMTITSNKAYYERMKFFVDKNYARKGWGARAYLSLSPNYRMNELTAAVGLAQLKKVKNVVQKRNELGTHLTQLLSDIPEIIPAPVTSGAQSSYWLYPMHLKNGDIESFAKKMKEQKIGVSAGYTGKPIYLCSESLTAKKTFGDSQFPFSPRVTDKIYEYKEGLCPHAEEALKHLICIPLNESWDKARVEKIVAAIRLCLSQSSTRSAVTDFPIQESSSSSPLPQEGKKIRVGIIGCGQMGRWHLDSYKKNFQVELVAFADTDLEKAKDFAKKINTSVRVYKTHQEMIKNERLDGVSVCTVPSTHYDIVLDLLDAGIHVLCEKPLAISVDQSQAMTEKANEKKLVLLTAFKFRFYEEVLKAKELIEKGSLGRILNFRLMFGGYINVAGSWYVQREISGGGVVMDNGPHAFDLIRYLLGDIEKISANFHNCQNLEVEDTAQINCVLKNGPVGNIDLSWSTSVPSKTYLEIYGEDGTVLLDLKGLTYKFKSWDEWKRISHEMGMKEGFIRQINHFVDALNGKSPYVVVNEDGLKTQILIDEVYHSVMAEQKEGILE